MSKIIKISLITLGSVLGLLLILWLIMQTSWFQHYLIQKITRRLSADLETTVSIDAIKLSYFDHLILSDVLVLDQNEDTMFYIQKMDANYNLFAWSASNFSFNKVKLYDADVRIGIHKGQDVLNLQFVIDYFTPDSISPQSIAPVLSFDRLLLTNCRFNYFDHNYEAPESRDFNENNMIFSAISGDLKHFKIINDSIVFRSRSLSAQEQCGLVVDDLTGDFTISSSTMNFEHLRLITARSDIRDHLQFSYHSYRDFSRFIELVQMEVNLDDALIHTKDLAYFSDELDVYDDIISGSGLFTGTIDNIHGSDLLLNVGNFSAFEGQARIKGIPEMDNTYWDIEAVMLSSNSTELARYAQLDNTPYELIQLGNLSFKGKFQGFLNQFVCYGDLTTDLGPAKADLKFEVNPDGREIYSGTLSSPGINLGPLLDYSNIGYTGFDLSVEGKGLKIENLDADINGTIQYINLNDYAYKNIEIDGNIQKDVYEGYAKISDPNLDLDFEGTIDASVDNPTINVIAHANKINLKTIGLDTEESYLRFDGKINMESFEDDIYGTVHLDSISLERSGQTLPLKDITLIASRANLNSDKQILLQSEVLHLQLTGEYTLLGLPAIAENILSYVLPHDEDELKEEFPVSKIHLVASVPSFHPLLEEYMPENSFEQVYLTLDFDSEKDVIHSAGHIIKPEYQHIHADSLWFTFDRSSRYEPLLSAIRLNEVYQKDTFLVQEVIFEGKLMNKRLDFDLKALRDSTLSAEVQAYLIARNDSVEVFINELNALVNNKVWHMEKTRFANVVYHNHLLELLYIDLRNEEEIIFIDATLGSEMQRVSLVLDNFLLENLNPFITASGIQLGGVSRGFIDIKYTNNFPIFESDLSIDDLVYDGERLGNFTLLTSSGENPLEIIVDGDIKDGLVTEMSIDGKVDFNTPDDALHIDLHAENSPIQFFEPYLEGLASGLEGHISVDLAVRGAIDAPELSGQGVMDDLKFKVDYLQTVYTSRATIEVGNDYFRFKDAVIRDQFGSQGIVTGSIRHQNYRQFNFDIDILDLRNFECMNTTEEDNELFYGSVFADGKMKIAGPIEDILLQIEAKSRRGTKIYIPLDDIETSGQVSYIEFVDFNRDNSNLKNTVKTVDGVRMDFNFEITNDADIELIFDELLGDVIKGNCRGNLRMEINTYGDFNMYGRLTIDRGSYLFTAFNFINKYFTVEPGGTLYWDGDPYNATIDMVAEKREYPVPYTLLAGMVSEEDANKYYKNPIPVDCQIHLTGLLFNPNISFDLEFPSSNSLATSGTSTFNTVMERVRQDPEELDRQVFALIVLGSFIPPSFVSSNGVFTDGTGIQSSVNNNLSEFVSSQLSNWLSQIDSKFQLGVEYQGSTEISRAELILSIKRKFWGDRFEFQGSYDVASAGGNNIYDINLQYDLTDDGTFKLKGFTRNANDPTLGNITNLTTTGLGLFYRHEFDYFWFNKPNASDSLSRDSLP